MLLEVLCQVGLVGFEFVPANDADVAVKEPALKSEERAIGRLAPNQVFALRPFVELEEPKELPCLKGYQLQR